MENIQLDMSFISSESATANTPEQGNTGTQNASNKPFFSKVLAKEKTPEKTSEESTSERNDNEQTTVADGHSLPGEDTDRPQETEKKTKTTPPLAEGESNTPLLPGEQASLEVTEQTQLSETIKTTESSPVVIKEDAVKTVENLVPSEDNTIQVVLPVETREADIPLKEGRTPELVVADIETEATLTPPNVSPESDARAEILTALNPQAATHLRPSIDPENKTSKTGQKNGTINMLSVVDSKLNANNVIDTEGQFETTDSDLLLTESVQPEMPAQSPVARALVREFAEIQSNANPQNTLENEIGIKPGDIQTHAVRPPVQLANTVQTTPLPPINMNRPGWEQSFANHVSWMNNENIQTANIRISPADLGPIEIKMTAKQDQLTLNIHAHHVLTRETMENAMPRLKEILTNNGYNSVNVDVSGQQASGGHAENNTSTGSSWLGSNEGSESESEHDGNGLIQPEQRMTASGVGMVDIFA